MSKEVKIVWTTHAIERVGERFGFDSSIKIPNEMIVRLTESSVDGKSVSIGFGDVVYICIRSGSVVKIVTVQKKKKPLKALKQRRLRCFSE